jgi:beta-glucosidase/6-phospho-beta-glucosidase/beta-galactosidase
MNAGSNGDYDQASIWPEALYDHLNNLSKLINDPAVLKGRPPLLLYILENGWVDGKKKPMDRAEYIRSHVLQVQRAYNAGLNVKMYLYWSLTTNNEWGLPIGPNTDFGLYHIDLKKEPGESGYQVRNETDVCKLYKDIVDKKGVPLNIKSKAAQIPINRKCQSSLQAPSSLPCRSGIFAHSPISIIRHG